MNILYTLCYYVESDDEYLEDGILKDSNTYWCSRRFSSLLQDSSTHDVTFKTSDGATVSAHRAIVAAGSPVLHIMLYGSMKESSEKEIELPNIDSGTLKRLLYYIYTGRIRASLPDCLELLRVAYYFNVNTWCVHTIYEAMTVSNYLNIITYALQWQLDPLLERCIKFMENHAKDVVNSSEFNSLPLDVLGTFVKSSHLEIREVELFMAVVEWCKQQNDTKADNDVKSLFQQIRYPLIQKNDLIEKVHPTNMADLDLYKAALQYYNTDKYDGPEEQLKVRRYYFEFQAEYPQDVRIEYTDKGTVITNDNGPPYEGTKCFTTIYLRDNKPVNFALTLTTCCDKIEAQLLLRSRDHQRKTGQDSVDIPLGEEVQGSITKGNGKISAIVGDVWLDIFLINDTEDSCVFGVELYEGEQVCIYRI